MVPLSPNAPPPCALLGPFSVLATTGNRSKLDRQKIAFEVKMQSIGQSMNLSQYPACSYCSCYCCGQRAQKSVTGANGNIGVRFAATENSKREGYTHPKMYLHIPGTWCKTRQNQPIHASVHPPPTPLVQGSPATGLSYATAYDARGTQGSQ